MPKSQQTPFTASHSACSCVCVGSKEGHHHNKCADAKTTNSVLLNLITFLLSAFYYAVFVFYYIVLIVQILNVFIKEKRREKVPFANFPDFPILSGNIMLMKMVSDN